MSRNLYDIIENSDLNMRSRIDLKKEIKSNKITDENTLLIRINQKKEEELKQIEERLNDENKSSIISPISNKSELKLKIEDENYAPTKKELYSYVINSKTNQRFKDRMKKEINNTEDYGNIMKKVNEEERKHKLISLVNSSNIEFSTKRKLINKINMNIIKSDTDLKTSIEDGKIKSEDEKRKEEKIRQTRFLKSKENKNKNKKDRLKRIVDRGFVGSSYRLIHNYSKELIKKDIEYNILTNEYEIFSKINSEAGKEPLYSYLDNLPNLTSGSSLNYPIKHKLKNLIYDGKLLTESEIDIEKERIIKKKVEAMNKKQKEKRNANIYSGYYNGNYSHLGGWER